MAHFQKNNRMKIKTCATAKKIAYIVANGGRATAGKKIVVSGGPDLKYNTHFQLSCSKTFP